MVYLMTLYKPQRLKEIIINIMRMLWKEVVVARFKVRGSYRKSRATCFAYKLGTADEGKYGGRWNQLLCYPWVSCDINSLHHVTSITPNKMADNNMSFRQRAVIEILVNPLTTNDHYSGCTAPLTSKRCILYIYSTNIVTAYFKHGIYSPFFSLFKMQFVS